ncbi:MAG: hypothetical protein LBV60_15265 [Streptomyces sp.]|jgi:hypothetical protein|nr:hypothetical protein [Streptomyces sp.]
MTGHDHQADRERVRDQNDFTDFARGVEDDNTGGGWLNPILRAAVGVTPAGQALDARESNFEDPRIELNTMLDMVQQSNPEDLESSGTALWNARDAIEKAASELDGHITRVHWVGESGDSFRNFGSDLVKYGRELSTFAGSAGDQLSAASMGLASVRGAMPERDTRPAEQRKLRPEQYPAHKQTSDDPEYAAAVKVEKHRQEAINQMNRLSSYYIVSKKGLDTLSSHPPKLRTMPDVGVPKPVTERHWSGGGGGGGTRDGGSIDPVTGSRRPTDADVSTPPQADGSTRHEIPVKDVEGTITMPDRHVGTEIDSVGTLPPPTTHTPTPTPTTGPTAGPNGPSPMGPSATGYVPPMANPAGNRGIGPAGSRSPISAQGSSGGKTSGTSNAGTSRGVGRGGAGEMGRASQTGRAAGAPGKGSTSAGRGISGGTARPTGKAAGTPRAGGTSGAARSNGVVGGKPSQTGRAGGLGGKTGSRIPRGSVVGAETTGTGSRSTTGRVGQRGVIGAQGSKDPSRTAKAERNGMTRGGSGLVRGPGKNGKPEEEEVDPAERPDYVVEDVETHLPSNRRDVPPVVN